MYDYVGLCLVLSCSSELLRLQRALLERCDLCGSVCKLRQTKAGWLELYSRGLGHGVWPLCLDLSYAGSFGYGTRSLIMLTPRSIRLACWMLASKVLGLACKIYSLLVVYQLKHNFIWLEESCKCCYGFHSDTSSVGVQSMRKHITWKIANSFEATRGNEIVYVCV